MREASGREVRHPRCRSETGAREFARQLADEYIEPFGKDENWPEEWTVFGAETDYDPREADAEQ